MLSNGEYAAALLVMALKQKLEYPQQRSFHTPMQPFSGS